MLKNDFPYPKLNLPKELKILEKESKYELFQPVSEYIHLVSDYIYTEIDLNDDSYELSHKYAWILKIVSANLLRSIYIRNSVVDAINSRNIISMHLALKAWFEVVGLLASILDLLKNNYGSEEFLEKFRPYAIGNKGKGEFRIGDIDTKSVMTMIQKADKYLEKLTGEIDRENVSESYFTDFYDIASGVSHPCFDAYELLGSLRGEKWHAFSPEGFRKQIVNNRAGYGGLMLSPLCIKNICEEIFVICKDGFNLTKSVKYFN